MPIVEIRNLAKKYGSKTVLRNVNLSVEPGDFTVIYGAPTSGKSVLVRLLTGLEAPDAGAILLRGQDVTRAGAGERNIGYVPQSFALYPHFSVQANIAYPLTLTGTPKSEIQAAVQRVANLLGIEQFLDRRPDQLSGGQKQRVAIARGLVKKTEVYVLDDPLVGLDFKLRERLIDDLRQTQETLKVTFIYTTSDAIETLMLAKQVAVLDTGEIVEAGAPEALYTNPQRAQTMRYVGFPQASFLEGTLQLRRDQSHTNQLQVDTGIFRANVAAQLAQLNDQTNLLDGAGRGRVTVGIRPEHILIGDPSNDQRAARALTAQAKVLLREDLGGEEIVYLAVQGQPLTTVLRHSNDQLPAVEIDQTITISVQPANLLVFVDGKQIGRGC